MFISLNRILELFLGGKQKISNPKPTLEIQILFGEILE
jgi:hypothetical protein